MNIREELRERLYKYRNNPKIERFITKVAEQPDSNGCWNWIGGVSRKSKDHRIAYGSLGGSRAHRVSYQWLVGPIPEGKVIMHTCDNTLCVNPDHLQAGTQAENVADMITKGRNVTVSQKLNADKASEIREKYATGNYTQKQLAEEYDVTIPQISKVVNFIWWKHIA